MQEVESHIYNTSFTKTILMMLVVLYHSCVFWTGDWLRIQPVFNAPLLGLIAKWLNSFHIYAFTLVSGYIFAFKMTGGGINNIEDFSKIRQKDC